MLSRIQYRGYNIRFKHKNEPEHDQIFNIDGTTSVTQLEELLNTILEETSSNKYTFSFNNQPIDHHLNEASLKEEVTNVIVYENKLKRNIQNVLNDPIIEVPHKIRRMVTDPSCRYDKLWFYLKAFKSHLEDIVVKETKKDPEYKDYPRKASMFYDVKELKFHLDAAVKKDIPKNRAGKFRTVQLGTDQQEGVRKMHGAIDDDVMKALQKIGYGSLYFYLNTVITCIEQAAGENLDEHPGGDLRKYYHAETHWEHDLERLKLELDSIDDDVIRYFHSLQNELSYAESSAGAAGPSEIRSSAAAGASDIGSSAESAIPSSENEKVQDKEDHDYSLGSLGTEDDPIIFD